ncbi:MAG TPA: hypothetical protein VGA78_08675 [Gemmatimonadales bacterium]
MDSSPVLPSPSLAIPAFARRYRVSCQLCHNPIPKLTAFGEVFAGNGYRFAAAEAPRDTIATGDSLLWLASGLPLGIRVDAYAQAYSRGRTSTDLQTPYLIKVLSSGALSKSLSYYMYVNLLERGEFGGFEDAILIANDIAGLPVDASLGQFQVSDPLFKRELRLMFEDYAVYRARLGQEPANLTYDRGLMAAVDVLGFTLTGELLNGNGIGPADEERRFDDNGFKNLAGHLTRDLTAFLRLGVFGYYGRTDAETGTNTIHMLGGDGTLSLGPLELNGQYLHREDSDPRFTPGTGKVRLDGGFVEAVLRPPGSRWHAFGLWNRVSATAPVLDVRLGGPADLTRYQTVSGGAGYLVLRNLRLSGELTRDLEQDATRWTLGFVTAF